MSLPLRTRSLERPKPCAQVSQLVEMRAVDVVDGRRHVTIERENFGELAFGPDHPKSICTPPLLDSSLRLLRPAKLHV